MPIDRENSQEIFDEGIGQRMETGLRILDKMVKNIEYAIEFMKDKLEEMEANNGFLMDYEELPFLTKLFVAGEDDDYGLLKTEINTFKNDRRLNFNS